MRHDGDIVAYQLDVAEAGHAEGEKTADGVLLARLPGRAVAVFVELKSTLKPKKTGESRLEGAFAQVDAAVEHFHPSGRSGRPPTHGDHHHAAFVDASDPVEVMQAAGHDVVAVVVTFKQVPRDAPRPPRQLGEKLVVCAPVQVSPADRNRAEIELATLLRHAGWR